MAEAQRLITLKNVTEQPVSITWDGVEYTWQPGEEKTLVYGVGLHARDNRQSQLEVVGDSVGIAPDLIKTEVQLVNNGKEFLSVMWDGVAYGFNPGDVVTVDESIAHALMTNARTFIAQNDLDATLDLVETDGPVSVSTPPPTEPPILNDEPAVTPKKTRKSKKTKAE